MKNTDAPLSREDIAKRAAQDVPPLTFANLGIGMPTLISNYLNADQKVILHTENGMLNMGPEAHGDEVDPELINAGKIPVTELPGSSYFHHADSFAMMRGGHLDLCVMGAFQVAVNGDLANWHSGKPDAIPAVGGAMDLAVGAKDVWVMMTMFTKKGEPKLVRALTMPVTGIGCVKRVYTDLATIELTGAAPIVHDTHGVTVAELSEKLGFDLVDATEDF
ncbi:MULTISPECIES: 3-oxoacid CoA-transferase subunit B [Trueperella]|uniref:3-oxoadipate CoA-transferase beta subunit n=1 Tax=Trueperella abortisuis TaxID=445930 RepID=A0ABT9PG72_9ACTO|nr:MULTISPECIES: 3-oxoacid CoA-transferase subunit B [Trueperella]MCI7305865.1 3-oxoacid CoA-transferase subunit B [Trueperella sp.]MDP9831716.1 3-oxoadipate CoA-transferase beta subunit [Trueperella abortisuis]MDY5403911.1 3-oxoacid CoA-transferase subunit B [Trueperella sp.]